MSKFNPTPLFGLRCINCGHESHCGTRLYKTIKNYEAEGEISVCVCHNCICTSCAKKDDE